jgi:hypothetical protein
MTPHEYVMSQKHIAIPQHIKQETMDNIVKWSRENKLWSMRFWCKYIKEYGDTYWQSRSVNNIYTQLTTYCKEQSFIVPSQTYADFWENSPDISIQETRELFEEVNKIKEQT